MKAYVIANIDVTDADGYEGYKAGAAASLAAHGGRYIVRGGRTEVLDGDVTPKRVAILEFPDWDSARRWHASAEYQAVLPLRQANSISSAVLVEGNSD